MCGLLMPVDSDPLSERTPPCQRGAVRTGCFHGKIWTDQLFRSLLLTAVSQEAALASPNLLLLNDRFDLASWQ